MKKLILILLLILASCNSKTAPSKSSREFYERYLLFDLEREVSSFVCPIQGEIPSWLTGTLLRNGPAKFQVGKERVDWFDGLAMLHAFEFDSNQVLYSNRFLRSKQYYIMMVEKSLSFSGFAQDPCSKVFKNQTSRYIPKEMEPIHNANITIQQYADQMVALTEVPLPVVFDPHTLETLGVFDYGDQLQQGQWESAHALHDEQSGETFNYFVRFGPKSAYVIWKMVDGQQNRETLAEIPVRLPSYMHSFALTERYVVLTEYPFVVHPIDLMEMKKPFIFNYQWKPKQGTRFTIVERATGQITQIQGDPFFAFHHANAYDEEGKIYLDIVTYKDASIIAALDQKEMDSEKIQESEPTKLERFAIDLKTKNIFRETLFEKNLEMPRVAADRVAQKYRYCYSVDLDFPETLDAQRSLYKIDVANKSAISWSEEGCFPGEPIFVSRPDAKEEDDGVVLSLVLDLIQQSSFLLILDAKDFQELARAEAPHAIPIGLHGLWRNPV